MNIFILAINNIGKGLSGGDTIWVNLIKQWQNRAQMTLIGSSEAIETLAGRGIARVLIFRCSPPYELSNPFTKYAIFKNTIYKTYYGVKFVIKHLSMFNGIVYSASDFLPDFVPALLIKLFRPKVKWVAGFYLFAPSPCDKDNPYKYDFFRGLFFWLQQRVSYPLIKRYADVVCVTSLPDKEKFPRAIVVKGGVNIPDVKTCPSVP